MSVQKLNDPWRAYHRFVFRICAAHLSPSDSLVEFAVTVAEAEELSRCASHILTWSEQLKLPPDARAELESIAPAADNAGQDAAAAPAPLQLRRICKRVASGGSRSRRAPPAHSLTLLLSPVLFHHNSPGHG